MLYISLRHTYLYIERLTTFEKESKICRLIVGSRWPIGTNKEFIVGNFYSVFSAEVSEKANLTLGFLFLLILFERHKFLGHIFSYTECFAQFIERDLRVRRNVVANNIVYKFGLLGVLFTLVNVIAVSYTHLTLPTILRV